MIPILKVREIIGMPSITALPHLPDYIRGITNLRGTVIPVINLKSLLNSDNGNENGNTVIVIATGKVTFGVIVDGITGVINADEDSIEPPDNFSSNVEHIEGLAKFGGKLIVLLDTRKLLPLDDLTLLEDSIVDIMDVDEQGNVEVVKEIETIGGRVTVTEVHKAKEYLGNIDKGDPRHALFDHVLEFMEVLSTGDHDRIEGVLEKLLSASDSDIVREVGKITRKLHTSLEEFKSSIDTGLQKLASNDVPNAVDKLQFVISKTEDAANKTMALVERYFEEEDDFSQQINNIKGFDEEVEYLSTFKSSLDSTMTEILTAQQFQDITGQTIKKVINLVINIESELSKLVSRFGSQVKPDDRMASTAVTAECCTEDNAAAGERVTQSDVEILLNDNGF
jgi:chemotaxis protein CheZ